MSSEVEQVRAYYDRNTERFLRLGQGGEFGAIHRAVWGPGVVDEQGAFHFVDDLIADRLRSLNTGQNGRELHVVDLGCGVGASLCRLAPSLPLRGTGVTLSPVQAQIATRRIAAAGLADRLRIVRADFCALPPEVETADLAFGIESFLHVADRARFFAECTRLIRVGGLLVLCDDMLGAHAGAPRAHRWLSRFRRGWHAHTLLSPEQIAALAAPAFVLRESIDLTRHLEIRRFRDYGVAALMHAFGWLPMTEPRFASLVGGHALQVCLNRGYLTHSVLVFERVAHD